LRPEDEGQHDELSLSRSTTFSGYGRNIPVAPINLDPGQAKNLAMAHASINQNGVQEKGHGFRGVGTDRLQKPQDFFEN
jgi:hypothetical protein